MSGGYFDYNQFQIQDIVTKIDQLIKNNNSTEKQLFGFSDEVGYHFSPEVIEIFKEASNNLRHSAKMAHLIDWLVSGDGGEETFLKIWNEEIKGKLNE